MITYYFKAYFIRKNDNSYIVEIPELDDCFTCGKTFDEAYSSATELVKKYFEEHPNQLYHYLRVYNGYEEYEIDEHVKVATIVFDVDEFVKENYTDEVTMTLRVPEWVDHFISRENISVAESLQTAVEEYMAEYEN